MNLTSIILFVAAAIFKAIADTLYHHYYESVFRNRNERWWNPQVSYKYVKFLPLTKYRPDAWHLCNSAMIISFTMAVVSHSAKLQWIWELLIAGVLWQLVFNVFYNKILRK